MGSFVNYKNTSIHFTDTGKGTAVVLLHGFLENCTMWKETADLLCKRNRVICVDLLGHGQTENRGYVHSMDEMATGVAAVLNHLRIRKAIFVGHSMGGYVALAFAEMHPDHVKGLCLMNSTSRADTEEKKASRSKAIQLVKKNHLSFIRTSIPLLFRSKNRKLLRTEINEVKQQALAYKKYFMHGTSHHMGLDTHDYGLLTEPMQANMVCTVEPGIYIPEEGFGIRLEDDVVLQESGSPFNLMHDIPIEVEEIESLMNS